MSAESGGKELGRQIEIWADTVNIDWGVKFHNVIFDALNRRIEDIDRDYRAAEDKSMKASLKADKHIYENLMTQNLRNLTLVLHLSTFEEISYHVCNEEGQPPKGLGFAKRFKAGWMSRIAKPLGDVKEWDIVVRATKVRNCILHADGRPKRLQENLRKELEPILKAEKIPLKSSRISVPTEYLDKVARAMIGLVQFGSKTKGD